MPDARDPQAVIAAAEQAALAGDYAAAERLLREAAGLQEASLGPLHPELANTLNNLGVVYEVTEKPDEAERAFRRAFEIAAAVLSPDHPFVATSRKNLEDFCAARGIAVDERAPAKAAEPQPIERPAIEPTSAPITPPPVVAPAAVLQKQAIETPTVAERPSRSAVVPGLVAAALIVAVLFGRMWFGSSEVPAPAAEPAASAPVASPVVAPEPSPAKTTPVQVPKPVPPVKPQPAKTARAADAPGAKGAPIVVSVQLCASLGTSGPGEWRCDPPRNPASAGRLYFYTRLKSQRETKVQHRWYQGERLRQSVELTVHANPGAGYRTYSRNTVTAGDWRVELRTRDGGLLREERFTVR
jgi:hypothetical protein